MSFFDADNDLDSLINIYINDDKTSSNIFNDFNMQNNNDKRVIKAYESDLKSEYNKSTGSKYILAKNQTFESWKSVD
ncbi:952_t:CDS:1, partial [Racocetra persica]